MTVSDFFAATSVFIICGFLWACDSQTTSFSGSSGATTTSIGATQISSGTGSGTGTLIGTAALDSEEIAFFNLINAYREQNGLSALQLSIALTQSSDWMSQDMATHNYLAHTDSLGRDPSARMAAFGYTYDWWGENVAAGNATGQDTFTQWKNSPAHNANMLDSNYKVIGIARAYSASSSYGWYWTTDFGGTVDATYVP